MKYVSFNFECEKLLADKRPRINTVTKRAYPDSDREDYKDLIRWSFKSVSVSHEEYRGAITLDVKCYRSLPESTPKSIVSEPDTAKPDVDNLVKIIMDALTGIAWHDDSQVTDLQATKKERARRTKEMCYVRIGYVEMEEE